MGDQEADGDRRRAANGRVVSVLEGGYDLQGLAIRPPPTSPR